MRITNELPDWFFKSRNTALQKAKDALADAERQTHEKANGDETTTRLSRIVQKRVNATQGGD